MGRSSRIVLRIAVALLVLLTLAVGALRFMLPRINDYREPILATVSDMTGIPTRIEHMEGKWEMFGPTLDLRELSLQTDVGEVRVDRVTVALDVWASLVNFRWQFRDLTFYRVQGALNYTVGQSQSDDGREPTGSATLKNIFLKQFDHFILLDSQLSFLGASGERISLAIPRLNWLNDRKRHRAEGQVSVSTENGPNGLLKVRFNLRDEADLMDNGTVYLQADNVNVLPWLSHWFKTNTGFDDARFSLEAWLSVKASQIDGGALLLSQGRADWHKGDDLHRLDVEKLAVYVKRQGDGWRLDAPALNLKTDGHAWAKGGRVSLFWQPENPSLQGEEGESMLRIRAAKLDLESINPLLPMFSFLQPDALDAWLQIRPKGNLERLALDIPLSTPEKIRFEGRWENASWQPWKHIPGGDRAEFEVAGSAAGGTVGVRLDQSTLPYDEMFRAPLIVNSANASIHWLNDEHEFRLWGDNIDIQAKSVWANGSFSYRQGGDDAPWLSILAGIRAYDAGDAWRYFPEPLMGTPLVDYLSSAIVAGKSDNATLIFNGDPHHFPYPHNDGLFEVYAPLTDAVFKFQPTWQPLSDMTINLNFINSGLWMHSPSAMLGKVKGTDIDAVIADFHKGQLDINAKVNGQGPDVRDYLKQSPLKDTVGSALDEIDVGGEVNGRLRLDIPLDGEQAHASGEIDLKDNRLHIKPIDSIMEKVSGRFRFDDGNLSSERMSAEWFNQPIGLNFSTRQGAKDYAVQVGIDGNWAVAQLPWLPVDAAKQLSGSARWKSDVNITLPEKGRPRYDVALSGDLNGVSSRLPAPLSKRSGSVLPVTLKAKGDTVGFDLQGLIAGNQAINSRWTLGKNQVQLTRFAWRMNSKKTPELPSDARLDIQLPAVDGERLLGLLSPLSGSDGKESAVAAKFTLPSRWVIHSPQLELAGQYWRDLTVDVNRSAGATSVALNGKEIRASLAMNGSQPWQADIDYFYFNPKSDLFSVSSTKNKGAGAAFNRFPQLPSIAVRCKECWVVGQRLGVVNADLRFRGDNLSVTNGLVDTGTTKLTFSADWLRSPGGSATRFDGTLSGKRIDRSMNYFGVYTPLKDAPFNVDFDLNWQGDPWSPLVDTLNGGVTAKLGKGQVDNAGGGHAGQLLRLLSFNALLRKLQFDFRDTFGKGFYFDTISGSIKLTNGVAKTDNLLVDGLSADIAIDGDIDFVNRRLGLNAVVAPEISGTVGVATAFVVNPIAGAAVFAASQVLSPLWNKISLIRYRIDGDLDEPVVHEVLRQPKGDSS
ncbi:AsmA2 domain-containing protein YhdP [Leminorella grimontii]|uniref:AsmA2 domain-containing protein YhdP n=1 Tax=Leminorella grimontii TaxID=82981 RepID=UPI00041C52A3|nr:AsmA2 domain-containing protein YhdP [Leminorella grimontii]KFC94746.1 putative exported protein [Leminorella grimontii ATCC 33999 = DSM 5078]VFS61429.1 Uncharacterized protein involved in outer membrane biogenesis [Leminorella grimontii]